jgi:adhesin transport system outer membrane protein
MKIRLFYHVSMAALIIGGMGASSALAQTGWQTSSKGINQDVMVKPSAPSSAPGMGTRVVNPVPAIPPADQMGNQVNPADRAVMNAAPASIGAPRLVTLRDAVAKGVYTHPEYGVVTNNRRATDEELVQAKAGYLPSVDVNADMGREWTKDDPQNAGDDTTTLWRYQAGITLTQMLFDGFETRYEVERQKARVASIAYRTWETTEFLGLDIIESYLNILRQRELLSIAQENVSKHQEIHDQMADSSSAGRTTEADLHQATARLASARANESSVREALRVSEAEFISRVGTVPRDLIKPEPMMSGISQDVEAEVKQALLGSPTLASVEADIGVAAAEVKQAKSTFMPQVDLQLNANHANDINGSDGDVDRARGLVVMNWNLYRGGADTARMREGVYRAAQAKENRAEKGRAVEEDVRKTWAQMVAASEREREFDIQANANEKVAAAYFDQFNLDRRTLLDVLDAQNEFFVARSNTINSHYVRLFAVYRLLALKGQLLPTLQVAYPTGVDPNDNNDRPF